MCLLFGQIQLEDIRRRPIREEGEGDIAGLRSRWTAGLPVTAVTGLKSPRKHGCLLKMMNGNLRWDRLGQGVILPDLSSRHPISGEAGEVTDSLVDLTSRLSSRVSHGDLILGVFKVKINTWTTKVISQIVASKATTLEVVHFKVIQMVSHKDILDLIVLLLIQDSCRTQITMVVHSQWSDHQTQGQHLEDSHSFLLVQWVVGTRRGHQGLGPQGSAGGAPGGGSADPMSCSRWLQRPSGLGIACFSK